MTQSQLSGKDINLTNLHWQTLEWIKDSQFFLDSIQQLMKNIHNRPIINEVCGQMSKDIELNLSSLADTILRQTTHLFKNHEGNLNLLIRDANSTDQSEVVKEHDTCKKHFMFIKNHYVEVKKGVASFIDKKEFGMRTRQVQPTPTFRGVLR